MPRVRFESTVPAVARAKTLHALDRSATVTGTGKHYHYFDWFGFMPLIKVNHIRFIILIRVLGGYANDCNYRNITLFAWSRGSSVGIPTGYGLGDWGGRSSSPGRVKRFLFSTSSRPTLGSTQTPIQWVPGSFPRE
jgi:hypothetical protein